MTEHKPHTPEEKIKEANQLRRKAFLRREQARNPKHPSDVGRLINDAATMEQNAETLEQDAKRMWRATSGDQP